jgi:hypothetical protein
MTDDQESSLRTPADRVLALDDAIRRLQILNGSIYVPLEPIPQEEIDMRKKLWQNLFSRYDIDRKKGLIFNYYKI